MIKIKKYKKIIIYLGVPILLLSIATFTLRRSGVGPSNDDSPGFTVSDAPIVTTFSVKEEEPELSISYTPGNNEDSVNSYNLISGEGIYESSDPPELSQAKQTMLKAKPHLPIYVENFQTSVGIDTTINIYTISGDRSDTLRIEIYNIDFQNSDVNPETNPDIVAFKESFLKAKEELRNIGVQMNEVNLIFGTRDHVQKTAGYWVDTLHLL